MAKTLACFWLRAMLNRQRGGPVMSETKSEIKWHPVVRAIAFVALLPAIAIIGTLYAPFVIIRALWTGKWVD